jgi:glyoxylase-like metal-dependent hydrolase (beta-lactamase superfamily II)
LTGDTLFIGDVGRPDLRGAMGWGAERLASMLYDSLHEKLARLPDGTLVYPAHGAGSLCGKSLSSETVSTIGVQRANNYALAPISSTLATVLASSRRCRFRTEAATPRGCRGHVPSIAFVRAASGAALSHGDEGLIRFGPAADSVTADAYR